MKASSSSSSSACAGGYGGAQSPPASSSLELNRELVLEFDSKLKQHQSTSQSLLSDFIAEIGKQSAATTSSYLMEEIYEKTQPEYSEFKKTRNKYWKLSPTVIWYDYNKNEYITPIEHILATRIEYKIVTQRYIFIYGNLHKSGVYTYTTPINNIYTCDNCKSLYSDFIKHSCYSNNSSTAGGDFAPPTAAATTSELHLYGEKFQKLMHAKSIQYIYDNYLNIYIHSMNLYIVRNYTPIPDYVLYQLASSHVKNRYHYYYSSNLVAYNSEFLTPFIDVDRFCNSSDERTLYLSLKHFTQFMHGVAEYDILITRANELIKCTELLLTINSPTADEYIDDELF